MAEGVDLVWRCRWSGCGDIGTDERRYRRLAAGWRIGELSSVIDGKGRGPAASSGRGAYSGVDESELVGVGTGGGHGDFDAADRDADLGADFEELGADRAAGGGCEPGMGEADPAQRAHQHIGERREPEAQLVGAHRRGAGAVGEEIELALLDPVLHVAASAIQLFVEGAGRPAVRLQRGHNEAWVGLAAAPFGFTDHPPPPRPAVSGRPEKVTEDPDRFASRLAGLPGFVEGLGEAFFQPFVAGEAEQVIDPVVFAPCHQALRAKPESARRTIRTRPRLPNVPDDPLDLLNAAARRIDVRAPQLGREQMSATEDVERQIAVTVVVVAVKEAAFLMAVQRIVGRVEIEHDLARRTRPAPDRCATHRDRRGLHSRERWRTPAGRSASAAGARPGRRGDHR